MECVPSMEDLLLSPVRWEAALITLTSGGAFQGFIYQYTDLQSSTSNELSTYYFEDERQVIAKYGIHRWQ